MEAGNAIVGTATEINILVEESISPIISWVAMKEIFSYCFMKVWMLVTSFQRWRRKIPKDDQVKQLPPHMVIPLTKWLGLFFYLFLHAILSKQNLGSWGTQKLCKCVWYKRVIFVTSLEIRTLFFGSPSTFMKKESNDDISSLTLSPQMHI